MINFPIKFEVHAESVGQLDKTWVSQANSLPPITSSIPPEFNGPGGGYSPEDLFALSIINCMIATFKVYCDKLKLKYEKIKGKASASLNRDPSTNQLILTEIDITLDITGALDPEKTRFALEQSIKNCPISNSVKTGKTFHLNVS